MHRTKAERAQRQLASTFKTKNHDYITLRARWQDFARRSHHLSSKLFHVLPSDACYSYSIC